MPDLLRLVFLGSDAIALPLLDWLAGAGSRLARLEAVFTGPDRPAGRGLAVRPNPVKAWTEGRGFPVFQPARLGPPELESLGAVRPDVALVVAYGQILRDAFIGIPRLGTLNLHASILPAYRGASPIQTAVAAGERETGLSLMRIVRELDAGPVADVERVPIGVRDTAGDVEARLAAAGRPLLERALPRLARGELAFHPQEAARASYCRRLSKDDGRLDFGAPASVLASRVNGLHPWPGALVEMAGQPIKLGLADWTVGEGGAAPGTVLGPDAEGLRVATGSGTLRLLRLQRPGGRMLEAPLFLRGFAVEAGTVLPSGAMSLLVAPAPFPRLC